jgi:acetolactate synthase regulatory subunit
VSLPQQLRIVPLLRVLPPDVAARYTADASPALLRSSTAVLTMDFLQPLRRPRVAGSRTEYVRLVSRMAALGMLGFTSAPKAVNGVFAVGKDAQSDRLIIDAQPANRRFVDSPHVALPGPSHLVQMCVPAGATMFTGKTDLSDYYHHQGVPDWMQPYFALPPLTPAELASCGLPAGAAFPMCLTLPMGFSHAVFLAQMAHEHVVYGSGALQREHSLLQLASPTVSRDRAVHGIVIDDFFLFSLSRELAEATVQRVLAAYRAAGFVVKTSKVVMPTSAAVKVIGFDIDGARSTIQLPAQSQLSLIQGTVAVMRAATVTGATLSHIVGRWTWVMMLRRCSLSVLQHAYRYCRVAQHRRFTLWPSVRRELDMLLSLLPLLRARLDTPFFHRAIASDASELAGGVVSTSLTPALGAELWPLCSARHHAVHQAQSNALRARTPDDAARALAAELLGVTASEVSGFDAFYSAVGAAPWRTLVSAPWSGTEHINALELRAALLAVHWALSSPSALSSRVFLLLDSTVAFFSLWKGRSSSPALLLVLRKISALLLAGGLSLLPGWVPSAVNPADAPSRLQPDACPPGRLAA